MVQSIIRQIVHIKDFIAKHFNLLFFIIACTYMATSTIGSYISIAFLSLVFAVLSHMAQSDRASHEISILDVILLLVAAGGFLCSQEIDIAILFRKFILVVMFFYMQHIVMRKVIHVSVEARGTETDSDSQECLAYIPYFALAISVPAILGCILIFKDTSAVASVLATVLADINAAAAVYYTSYIATIVTITVFLTIILAKKIVLYVQKYRCGGKVDIVSGMGEGDLIMLSLMAMVLPPAYFFITYISSLLFIAIKTLLMKKELILRC